MSKLKWHSNYGVKSNRMIRFIWRGRIGTWYADRGAIEYKWLKNNPCNTY